MKIPLGPRLKGGLEGRRSVICANTLHAGVYGVPRPSPLRGARSFARLSRLSSLSRVDGAAGAGFAPSLMRASSAASAATAAASSSVAPAPSRAAPSPAHELLALGPVSTLDLNGPRCCWMSCLAARRLASPPLFARALATGEGRLPFVIDDHGILVSPLENVLARLASFLPFACRLCPSLLIAAGAEIGCCVQSG